jgi:peptide-methionine (S)-S-oxide reductase
VTATRVGYTGGDAPDPTYDSVCDDDGHTEAVRVTFDPAVVAYDDILREFWQLSGSRAHKRRPKAQYRSALWVVDESQRAAAEASAAKLARETGQEVVTEISSVKEWYDAEERHQGYVAKHRAAKRARAGDAQRWLDDWTERGT